MSGTRDRGLDSLIRLAGSVVEGCQRDLAACYRREQELAAEAEALAADLAAEQELAARDDAPAVAFGAYAVAVLARQAALHNRQCQAEAATAAARDALAEAYRRLKGVEAVVARRNARLAAAAARREQSHLDDIAARRHRDPDRR